MKRFIAVLSGLLVLPAFAEVAPIYYEEIIEQYAENEVPEETQVQETVQEEQKKPVVPATPSPRATGRASTSRAVFSTPVTGNVATTRNSANTTRSVVARTGTTNAVQTTSARGAASRTATTNTASRAASSASAAQQAAGTQQKVTARRTVPTNGTSARASIIQTDTVNTPLYTGRVAVSNTSSVSARVPTTRMATGATTTSTTSVSDTTTSMDELAQLTDFCKAQYTQCMDNFCNVLDDNQGRCSCSANLKNYAKTEEALKQATEDLQQVAVQLNYLAKDLSADQIEALYTQTEAELTLQNSNDNSQIKTNLDDIKDMLVAVQSGKATSTTGTSGLSLDLSSFMNFSFDTSMFNLDTLLGTSSNTSSISNQRGEQLYKTASARCKASVLNSCAAQGVDISVITNSYDLEIDKQCIAYERSLTTANEEMYNKINAAKVMLQVARLQSTLNKNSNDLRGCINALDTCMQDDFVCGTDYENCIDPSGKFIANGEIILGSKPGVSGGKIDDNGKVFETGLYTTWNNGSDSAAWVGDTTLASYIDATISTTKPDEKAETMSEYLQNKIGYHDDSTGKDVGMCISALNTCQDQTYTGTGTSKKYQFDNKVIREYLQRTLVQIKAKQDTILADFAEDCITDVAQCLTQNNYNPDNPGITVSSIAIRACKPLITSCMSVNGVDGTLPGSDVSVEEWIANIMGAKTCPKENAASDGAGTYPNCKCAAGYTYDGSSNTCKQN